jgi:hypothetical protein
MCQSEIIIMIILLAHLQQMFGGHYRCLHRAHLVAPASNAISARDNDKGKDAFRKMYFDLLLPVAKSSRRFHHHRSLRESIEGWGLALLRLTTQGLTSPIRASRSDANKDKKTSRAK